MAKFLSGKVETEYNKVQKNNKKQLLLLQRLLIEHEKKKQIAGRL